MFIFPMSAIKLLRATFFKNRAGSKIDPLKFQDNHFFLIFFLNIHIKIEIKAEFHKIWIIFGSPTMGPKKRTFWGMGKSLFFLRVT